MLYWCSCCDHVFDSHRTALNENYIERGMNSCPTPGCDGELVHVDELMLPTIRRLNKLGYCTKFCCSGHVNEGGYQSPYIKFETFDDQEVGRMMYEQFKQYLPNPWYIGVHEIHNRASLDHLGLHNVPEIPYDYLAKCPSDPKEYQQYFDEISKAIDSVVYSEGWNCELIIRANLENWDDISDSWLKPDDFKKYIKDNDKYPNECLLCDNNEDECPDYHKKTKIKEYYNTKAFEAIDIKNRGHLMLQNNVVLKNEDQEAMSEFIEQAEEADSFYPDIDIKVKEKFSPEYYSRLMAEDYKDITLYRKIIRANYRLLDCTRYFCDLSDVY